MIRFTALDQGSEAPAATTTMLIGWSPQNAHLVAPFQSPLASMVLSPTLGLPTAIVT